MHYSRRSFLKDTSLTALLLAGTGFRQLSGDELENTRKKVILRFALASDGHYGQANTPGDESFEKITAAINNFHKQQSLNCCIINGDIIHNEKELLTRAKNHLDKLVVPFYVAKGNHDMVSDEYWQQVWGTSPDHIVKHKKHTFIIANTSNEKGEYLSPDLKWLKIQLDANKKQSTIFLVLHIPQTKWTANAIETPAFFELVKKYKNIKAVFHGHEHDQDSVKWRDGIPYLFDSHFGGNWGTSYKGFRVVELLNDNSIITYVMNPAEKINEMVHQ